LEKIAIYGKGGIGKSMVATSLTSSFASRGDRVLHVGCDPKHDSAIRLTKDGAQIPTVLDLLGDAATGLSTEQILTEGRLGVHLCEAGGPRPGLGCGGRGVARTLEFLDDMEVIDSGNYDVVMFDVLGDVVCGGFAAPLRQRFAEKVLIVMSEEPMALYAANNISRAIEVYHENGVVLGGLIANIKDPDTDIGALERFADTLSTKLLTVIHRDPLVTKAERKRQTVIEMFPESKITRVFAELAERVEAIDPSTVSLPTPMEDEAFHEFMEKW